MVANYVYDLVLRYALQNVKGGIAPTTYLQKMEYFTLTRPF